MKRRTFVAGVGASLPLLAGCTGGDDSGREPTTQSVDTGVVFDGTLTERREEQVTLSAAQKITVETAEIGEGEELMFTLGDGSKFVHSRAIRENKTTEFPVESDGWHNVRLAPDRYETPMSKDVAIRAAVTLSDP